MTVAIPLWGDVRNRTHPWFKGERPQARSHFPMLADAGTIVERIERFVRSLG